jgi:hypothetical protein
VGIFGSESFAGVPGASTLGLASGATPFTILVPYTNGTADFSMSLSADAYCSGTVPANGSELGCSSTADFLDTVSITGDSVYDTNGNLVSGATLISESGFNPDAVPTPEPSSLLMLGAGVLALAGAAKLKVLVS